MQKRMYTFKIQGGGAFTMSLPNTPKLEHSGGISIWRMVGTQEAVDSVKAFMELSKAKIEVYALEQTEEQAQIREDRLKGGIS
jgi:hypothetical protein